MVHATCRQIWSGCRPSEWSDRRPFVDLFIKTQHVDSNQSVVLQLTTRFVLLKRLRFHEFLYFTGKLLRSKARGLHFADGLQSYHAIRPNSDVLIQLRVEDKLDGDLVQGVKLVASGGQFIRSGRSSVSSRRSLAQTTSNASAGH